MLGNTLWIQLGLQALVASVAFVAGMSLGLEGGFTSSYRLTDWAWPAAIMALAVGVAASRLARDRRVRPPPETPARPVPAASPPHPVRHDALTGLLNRSVFMEQLRLVLESGREGDRRIAVLALDLADFRNVNERLGPAAGDLLLRHAGARLLANLRESDVLARMGADEFAIVQAGVADPSATAKLCERLLAALEAPFDLHGHETRIGMRIGVAFHRDDGSGPEVLVQRAGLALDRAKREGGSGFSFFEAGMDAQLHQRRSLERDLRHALERGELVVHYQPQIDIATRRMAGIEALLRWDHPERGRLAPDAFIPVAEDNGLIVPIGAWVLEQACAQAARWQEQGASGLRVAVNLSPAQFHHADLARLVAETLSRTGLAPEHLQLEITERVLMRDTAANLATLRRLREQGVRISIDDFGVGYSSLSYLQQFAFDEIKVDRSFVAALERAPSAAAIVRATLTLGRSLGMRSVAEGVETAEQLAILSGEGCGLAQGYYFSPPVSAAEIDVMVRAGAAGAAEPERMPGEVHRTA